MQYVGTLNAALEITDLNRVEILAQLRGFFYLFNHRTTLD